MKQGDWGLLVGRALAVAIATLAIGELSRAAQILEVFRAPFPSDPSEKVRVTLVEFGNTAFLLVATIMAWVFARKFYSIKPRIPVEEIPAALEARELKGALFRAIGAWFLIDGVRSTVGILAYRAAFAHTGAPNLALRSGDWRDDAVAACLGAIIVSFSFVPANSGSLWRGMNPPVDEK